MTTPQRNYLRLQRQKDKDKKDVRIAALSAQVSELTMASAGDAVTPTKVAKKKKKVSYDSQVERSDSNRSNRALMRQTVADSSDSDSSI